MRSPAMSLSCYCFIDDRATTGIYTLSLHDALPIWRRGAAVTPARAALPLALVACALACEGKRAVDRKSTRLNSSHSSISYAVFCLKKKNGDMRDVGD